MPSWPLLKRQYRDAYDAAGRMTSDRVNTYTWDRADRLLSMGSVQNEYNGQHV